MVFVGLLALGLGACSSGGATRASVSSPTTEGSALRWADNGVAIRLHSVVDLAPTGRIGGVVMSTVDNRANVVAVDHLADGSIVFLECCQNDTAMLRSNQDPKFAMPAFAFGVSTNGTKIAALDNNTGKISIYDIRTKSTRTIDTPLVKHAPWIGTEHESIAWSRDDQQLAIIAAGALLLLDVRDGSVTTNGMPRPKHHYRSPAVLPDGRVIVIDSVARDNTLVAIDARTGASAELAPLGKAVSRIAPLPNGHHVLFIGSGGYLSLVDIDTQKVADLHSKNDYEWIAP